MKLPTITDDAKRLAKRAAVFGAVLAMLCHLLPTEYRAPCAALASICKGEMP